MEFRTSMRAGLLAVLFCPVLLASARGLELEDYVDLDGLAGPGDAWVVKLERIDQDSGHIKLGNNRWLMYFLHWRPLTEQNRNISADYTREHMLNFWGESMPFTLTGVEGQTEVCGHPAYFVEGTIYEGAIRTRFVVWNCPRTGRQFTADCNINLRRGTPPELLDVQKDITATVTCHGEEAAPAPPSLTKKYQSSEWNVSFFTPENWHTADFLDDEWFPGGMTAVNGSLWTLLKDSEQRIELMWETTDQQISPSLFESFLNRLPQDSAIVRDTSLSMTIDLDGVDRRDDYVLGKGSHEYTVSRGKDIFGFTYKFRGLLCRHEGRAYFLIASMRSQDRFWDRAVDLVPSEQAMETFLWKEVIPNIHVITAKP